MALSITNIYTTINGLVIIYTLIGNPYKIPPIGDFAPTLLVPLKPPRAPVGGSRKSTTHL